ncbi:hypothetical protein [Flavobacterium taihuense]|uniref:HNH endonuclease n=1 Tax=Flavobacterium taihuense TaxID=2857508 RepID=A0ABS6Y1C2_9FLAO|nr:hypothetical protein [Flavobacterium taihuense]MBW4362729.1 hypothetical protein [Flavobacterium taihuense]
MIKISHSDIDKIVNDYSKEIYKEFIKKKKNIFEVIDILGNNNDINMQVIGKVKEYTVALKLLLNVKKLEVPKKIGDKKETEILIFNLKKNRVGIDLRSKCRKEKRYNQIKNQLNNIFKHILIDLFSAKPIDLKTKNEEFKNENLDTNIYNFFFDYQNYYDILNKFIGKELGIICCPYCNRNYISFIHDNKSKRIIGPTYDHFFHKSKYKFISLSFYNLIPSCYVCNSNLKNQVNFDLLTHLHPHIDEFGDNAVFDYDLSLINNINGKRKIFQPTIRLKAKIKEEDKLKLFGREKDIKGEVTGSIKVFKLKEIYQTHYDTVEEIHEKFDKNSPHYIKSIQDNLKRLGVAEDEFYRFHFNNYFYSGDFHKRPLAKLTKDIYNKMKQIQP